MRCETARLRYPDERARRHAAGCGSCTAWLGRLARARTAAAATLPPVPETAAGAVLTATREIAPPAAPPRGWVRPVAAAAAVAVLATTALVWGMVARPSPAEALTRAASITEASRSARFGFEGEFAISLRVPPELAAGLEGGGLQASDPGAIRKGLPDVVSIWRELLGEEAGSMLAALESLAPEVRLRIEGSGAFAPGDRVRLRADTRLEQPVEASGVLRMARVGDDLYLRPGEGAWLVGEDLPAVLGPVGEGLGELAAWIRDDAGLAERLPGVLLEGEETDRYSLPLAPARPGETRRAEVWVGAEDDLVRRVLLSYDLRRSFLTVRARIDARLRDHGAAIEVAPPAEAREDGVALFPPELRAALEQLEAVLGEGLPGPRWTG